MTPVERVTSAIRGTGWSMAMEDRIRLVCQRWNEPVPDEGVLVAWDREAAHAVALLDLPGRERWTEQGLGHAVVVSLEHELAGVARVALVSCDRLVTA